MPGRNADPHDVGWKESATTHGTSAVCAARNNLLPLAVVWFVLAGVIVSIWRSKDAVVLLMPAGFLVVQQALVATLGGLLLQVRAGRLAWRLRPMSPSTSGARAGELDAGAIDAIRPIARGRHRGLWFGFGWYIEMHLRDGGRVVLPYRLPSIYAATSAAERLRELLERATANSQYREPSRPAIVVLPAFAENATNAINQLHPIPTWLVIVPVGVAVFVGGFTALVLTRRSLHATTSTYSSSVKMHAIPPAPLPTGLPLTGPEGMDVYGYPKQYVDGPAVRSLLAHHRFEELTQGFEHFQEAFEADPSHEFWVAEAADAFASAEDTVLPLLDEWVQTTPNSYAPYLARATHWTGRWKESPSDLPEPPPGTRCPCIAPENQTAEMRAALIRAKDDAARAVLLRPKLVAARRLQIFDAMFQSDREGVSKALADATNVCPTCFLVRVAYAFALTPRWGGDFEAMDAFASKFREGPERKLRLLPGYVDLAKADILWCKKNYREGLTTINRALALGDTEDFHATRAVLEQALEQNEAALADYDAAVAVRGLPFGNPGPPVFGRAAVLGNLGRWDAAVPDVLAGLRVNGRPGYGWTTYGWVLDNVLYAAGARRAEGRRSEARRLYDLALSLNPDDAEVQRLRAGVASP
jgi:tetratricopeptide (TPR) repeat protein